MQVCDLVCHPPRLLTSQRKCKWLESYYPHLLRGQVGGKQDNTHLEALPGAPRVSAVSHLGAAEGSTCPLRPSGQRGGRVGGLLQGGLA